MEFLIDLKHKNTVFGVEYLTAELQLLWIFLCQSLIEFIDLDWLIDWLIDVSITFDDILL